MIGISIAASNEWDATLEFYGKKKADCVVFPFGMYFWESINGKQVLFYQCNVRKVCSAASAQYMIDHFSLERIIVAGTCAGIDDRYHQFDVLFPNKAVQYDCTVKETEPLIKEKLSVDLDLSELDFPHHSGVIGTADKPVVMWKDYLELKENNITIADTEAAGIAYVCKMNRVKCLIIKGISDFPTDESLSTRHSSHEQQFQLFLKNVPIVMNKIYTEYLPQII